MRKWKLLLTGQSAGVVFATDDDDSRHPARYERVEVVEASALRELEAESEHLRRTAARYEELRKVIDDGAEAMTHGDALEYVLAHTSAALRARELEAALHAARRDALNINQKVSTFGLAYGMVNRIDAALDRQNV